MHVCKCIPWDMIRNDDVEKVHMCDRFSNNCFQTKMKNTTHAKKSCFCLPKCDAIHFTQSEEKIPLDINNIHLKHSEEKLMVAIDRICQEFDPRKPYKQLLSNDLNDFLQMSTSTFCFQQFLDDRTKYKSDIEFYWVDICKLFSKWGDGYDQQSIDINLEDENEEKDEKLDSEKMKSCKKHILKDLTIIEIQLMSKGGYRKMSQKLRVTISDQIGSVGGTLGLFCGFSFLAIVEMIHWAWIGFKKILKQMRVQNIRS